MKHGSLIKSFQNMKIWKVPITHRLALSMVGIFHSTTKCFLFKSKYLTWNLLELNLVEILKFQHFTWLLKNYVIITPFPNWDYFGQMSSIIPFLM